MFDARLINQVVEWEGRMEIENRDQKYHRPEAYEHNPIALEPCQKAHRSSLVKVLKHIRDHNNFPHLHEPKADVDSQIYNEA